MQLALGTVLAASLVAPAAWPCGAPFGGVNIDPKQDILVVHKNGIETYVFQPRFCGSAQDFGLVLPVPAKLSQQPELSKAEIFPKLSALSAPQYQQATVCGRPDGGSRSGDSGTGSTVVVSSGTVGFMDYSQLETGSVEALTAWLDANGYPYDSQAQSTFDYYVKKGWLFLTFKISQGDLTGTTTCKDLGPVKLSFPSATPVVPSRMATARSKDTSGVLSGANSFSWTLYGITSGDHQVGFASPSSTRVLNFSGLIADADVAALDGLGVAGERATRMTLTFGYGSTEPDVVLALFAGQDFRETITRYTYSDCKDGGTDSAQSPLPVDANRREDSASPDRAVSMDAGETDAAVVIPIPPETGKADAGVVAVAVADAAWATETDAGPARTPEQPTMEAGCSCAVSAPAGHAVPLLMAVLVLALRRRRS